MPSPDSPIAIPSPRSRSAWDAWGTQPARLPAGAKALVATVLPGKAHPVARRNAPVLTPSRLTDDDVRALSAVAGPDRLARDDGARTLHLGGKSTPDLLARRLDDPQTAPDAVLSPSSHAETLTALRVCDARGIAVVPFGGGTSVVGGVDPESGAHTRVIALDLSPTAGLWALDEISLLATLGAGTTGPQAEEMLNARGYTLGHFPQSYEFASIGGYAATRSSGQASRGYGRFDDLVHALRIATPVGDLRLGRAPASAAGPDLRELFLGSEGAFGVITEVTVRIRLVPAATAYRILDLRRLRGRDDGPGRELTQRGIRPTVLAVERRERDPRQRADGWARPARAAASPSRRSRSRRNAAEVGDTLEKNGRAPPPSRRRGARRRARTIVAAWPVRLACPRRHSARHRRACRDARDGDDVGEPCAAQSRRHGRAHGQLRAPTGPRRS